MEEQWGLSVKLFGKTILVVPTSKGADTAQVCSDELLKHAELNSPVANLTETEEEIAVGSEVEYADRKPESGPKSGEEETEDEDPDELQLPQQEEKQREDDDDEIQKKEAAATEAASTKEEKEENDEKKTTMMEGKKKQAAEKPDKNKILPCPRCKSDDTKFCYYNNYNVNQPRHFCRNCQRYWTAGGTMRNVPVGAGRRKSKSAVAADASNSLYVLMLRHQQQQQQLQNGYITAEAAALHQPSMHTNKAGTVLSFSPSAPVACVNPIGHVNSPTQTAPGVVLVYSSGAGASTPTARIAAVAGNQFFPSCFNNFTNDQKKSQQLYYHNKSTMNVTNPPPNPNCASKFEPWMPPPTSSAQRVPVWQQPMHLGKHMRDGENNVKGDVKQRRLEDDDEDGRHRSIWVPKALRITDTPDAAASSSIWTTITGSGLGFNKKDQNHCGKMTPAAALERGFFNAFHTKENQVAASTTRPNKDNRGAVLSANPAAVARSHQFQETV